MMQDMNTVMEKEEPVLLKPLLETFGEERGFSPNVFHQRVLREFRKMDRDDCRLKVGAWRFGSVWIGYPSMVKPFIETLDFSERDKDLDPIPADLDEESFLASDGIYNLRKALRKLKPSIVNADRVIGAARRSDDPRREVGAFMMNHVYVLDMKYFSKWYREHEPLW